MIVTLVINNANNIRLEDASGNFVSLAKSDIKLVLNNDTVILYGSVSRANVLGCNSDNIYKLDYNQISDPAVGSQSALADAIDGYLNT